MYLSNVRIDILLDIFAGLCYYLQVPAGKYKFLHKRARKMIEEQLMLWEEPLEVRLNRRMNEFEEKMEDKGNRQRKSQFAKIGSITKTCNEIKEDFDHWKGFICKSNYMEEISSIKEEIKELRSLISHVSYLEKAEVIELLI